MASTLSTLAQIANATQSRRFLLQGAATDTTAESVTIAHLLGTWLGANSTTASQYMKANLSKHFAATSVLAPWYIVSIDTTNIVLARAQVAASAALLEVELLAIHSVIA